MQIYNGRALIPFHKLDKIAVNLRCSLADVDFGFINQFNRVDVLSFRIWSLVRKFGMMSLDELVRKSASIKAARVCLLAMLILAFVTVAFQIRFVHADPLTIDVSPVSAPVGDTLTVSGVNATAYGEVRIYVLGFLFFASTLANESGGYSVNAVVPAVPFGAYLIMAVDVASGDSASTMLNVEPRILLTPEEGSYNTVVSVKGDGFYSDRNVTLIDFDGIDVTPLPRPHTDFLGSFVASFNVPSRPNGTYTVTAADEWGASASASFRVVPEIWVWSMSNSHAPLSLIYVEGYGFGVSVNVTMFFGSFDVTPYPFLTTGASGYFGAPFFVPNVFDGVYPITVSDADGNVATAQFPVPGPILTLTPDRAFESSIVTVHGLGFQPRAPVLLYLEGVTMTSLIDLMRMSPNLMAAEDGSFEYKFIVPVTKPGVYTVSAYMMLGPAPAEPIWLASANLTIYDDAPLDVVVNVGSIHFRGEIAEFYLETAFDGKPVNTTVSKAMLYYSDGTLMQDLTADVGQVATGLYRIPYAAPGDAPLGTYVLVVEGNYTKDLIEAFGTSSGNFLLSHGFTDQNARLVDLQNKVGTIVIPDLGVIKANLTAINATLASVEGREITLQSDLGTLKTDADTINARLVAIDGKEATIQSDLGILMVDADAINAKVTSIDGNVATISSDLGTVKSQMTNQAADYTGPATLILSLIAAVGALSSLLYVRKIKPPSPATATSKPPETPPPTVTREEAPQTATEEEPATPIHEETPATPPAPETQTVPEEPTTTQEAPSEAPPTPETPQS